MTDQHRAHHVESAGDYYAHANTAQQFLTAGVENDDTRRTTEQDASAYSVSQGQQLLQGQQTRSDAPMPDTNYASHSHEELHKMVNQGLDFEAINARSRVTNTYGNWLADASNQFRDAATTAGAEWQGAAAEQAHAFFQSTADHTEKTGNAMQLVSNRYSQQSAAADYAHKNMPEPTGFNQQAEMDKATQAFQSGNVAQGALTMSGIAVQQQQADAAHQQAVQVMHNLDQTYHETSTTQPVYAPPPQMNSDSTTISSAAPVTAPGGPAGSGPYAGPGGHAFSGSSVPSAPGSGSSTFVPPSGGTPYTPGPGVSTGTGPLGNPGFSGGTGGLRPPTGIAGRLSPEGLAFGGGNVGSSGPGSESTTSPRGRTGAVGSRGGGAGGRVTGGAEESNGGKSGEGKGSGKGAAERLERGATAAANAGAGKSGKAGAAGAGAGGAGKKKEEEDKEHKNKIPTQVDPDEVFEVRPERGPNGEKITPPVLGG